MNHGYPVTQNPDFRMGVLHGLTLLFCSTQPHRPQSKQVAAFCPPEVRTQLKVVAAEQRRDVQDLLAEALNLIFAKYGRAEIAPRKAGHRE